MATKAQIARRKYGLSLNQLTSGQKAAVTREYNNQTTAPASSFDSYSGNNTGVVLAKFGRPGVNGLKECLIDENKTVKEALEQAGINVNTKKEGIMLKETGAIVMYNDTVQDGAVYMICPGIDSSI
jgi:hypothetical protein